MSNMAAARLPSLHVLVGVTGGTKDDLSIQNYCKYIANNAKTSGLNQPQNVCGHLHLGPLKALKISQNDKRFRG